MKVTQCQWMMGIGRVVGFCWAMGSVGASADSYFVRAAHVTAIADAEAEAATELLISALKSEGEGVTTREDQAEFSVQPKLIKLGGAYIFTVEKIKKEKTVFATQLRAESVEDFDVVSQRLARAIVAEKSAEKTGNIGSVTEKEEKGVRRKARVERFGYFALGPAFLMNAGDGVFSYFFSTAYVWDLGRFEIRPVADGMKTASGAGALLYGGLGVDYFVFDDDWSPYVGGDFGVGGIHVSNWDLYGGFAAGVDGGIRFFRTSSVNLDLSLRSVVLLRSTPEGVPYSVGARLGLSFKL